VFKKVIMMCGILFFASDIQAVEPAGVAIDVARAAAGVGVGYLYHKNCREGLNWKRLFGGVALAAALSASGGGRLPSALCEELRREELRLEGQFVAGFIFSCYTLPAVTACALASWRGFWDVMWERKGKKPDDGWPTLMRSGFLVIASGGIGFLVGSSSMIGTR